MEAGTGGNLRKKIDRLGDDPHQRAELARFQLLHGGRIVVQHLLDLDAEPLEHDRSGQARALPAGPKLTFLPRRSSMLWMSLRASTCISGHRQADDVVDPVLEVGRLALGAEIFEHVGLGHGDVDPAQIEQVVEIGRCPVGNHRKHAKIVAVVEDLRQFVREGQCRCRTGARPRPRPSKCSS